MALEDKLRDNVFPLSVITVALSVFFLILSSIWVFNIEAAKVSFIKDYCKTVDAWNWWVLVISVLALIIGAIYLYSYIKDSRRFEELIDTQSKAIFMKNMEELEELSFRLPSSYRERFLEKKAEFKIK